MPGPLAQRDPLAAGRGHDALDVTDHASGGSVFHLFLVCISAAGLAGSSAVLFFRGWQGLAFLPVACNLAMQYPMGCLADRHGRKRAYLLALTLLVAGNLLAVVADVMDVDPLFVGGVAIASCGTAGDYAPTAVMVAEFAAVAVRGRVLALVFLGQAVGIGWATLLDLGLRTAWGPSVTPLLACVFPVLALCFRAFLPESPRWTVHVRREPWIAAKDVERVTGLRVDRTAAELALDDRTTARDTALLGLCWFALDFLLYGRVFYDVDHRQQLPWVVPFLFAGTLASAAAIDRLGRRRLQLLGFLLAFPLALLECFRGRAQPYDALLLFLCNLGPNTVTYAWAAELFATPGRARAYAACAAMGKAGALLAFFGPQPLRTHLAAGLALLGAALTPFLPETNQVPLDRRAEPAIVPPTPFARHLRAFDPSYSLRRIYLLRPKLSSVSPEPTSPKLTSVPHPPTLELPSFTEIAEARSAARLAPIATRAPHAARVRSLLFASRGSSSSTDSPFAAR